MIYEGPSKIISQPVITFPADQLTSLEATVINNYIVVLAGTADGKIKKVIQLEFLSSRKWKYFEQKNRSVFNQQRKMLFNSKKYSFISENQFYET